jgi:hypothetical protein
MKRRGFLKESTIAASSITVGKVPGRASEIAAEELEGDYYSKTPQDFHRESTVRAA